MRTLDTVRFINRAMRQQRKINTLVGIHDRVQSMAVQGYSPCATNIRTLSKQYKAGVIYFRRRGW